MESRRTPLAGAPWSQAAPGGPAGKGPVQSVMVYLLLAVTPAAAMWAAARGLKRVIIGPPHRAGVGRSAAVPAGRPLDRLVQDLRRLERDYRLIEGSAEHGRARRLRAVGLAYDDTLRACCRSLGLPVAEASPLSALDRLRTEAALSQRGMIW